MKFPHYPPGTYLTITFNQIRDRLQCVIHAPRQYARIISTLSGYLGDLGVDKELFVWLTVSAATHNRLEVRDYTYTDTPDSFVVYNPGGDATKDPVVRTKNKDRGWTDTPYYPNPATPEEKTVSQYVSKPHYVEAIQWKGHNQSEVMEAIPSGEGGIVEFFSTPQGLQCRLLAGKDGAQGWVPVPVGHWIVRAKGDLSDHWPVEHDYFSNKYTEVERET